MITSIIFDVDGTLVDSVDFHAESWQRVLRRWGHDIPLAELRGQIGKGGDQLMPEYLSDAEVTRDGKAIEQARGELFKAEYLHKVQPFPAVAELFRHVLAQGRKIALGSSGKPEELDVYKRLVGIEDLDLVVTSSEDAERSKPHPDIFQAALQRLGAAPDQVVAVGDSPYDAIAANRAGIACVGMLCGGFAADDLTQAGCVALYKDPADLLAHFADSLLAG